MTEEFNVNSKADEYSACRTTRQSG